MDQVDLQLLIEFWSSSITFIIIDGFFLAEETICRIMDTKLDIDGECH